MRTKRSPYTIQDLRQVVRNEIYGILEDDFCTSKKQICIKGTKGENGRPGNPGSPGKSGLKGEKGTRGQPGLPGNTGKRGPAGSPGPSGRRGQRGYQGRAGFPGVKGDKGSKGDKGEPGVPGVPGESVSSPVITSPSVSLTINETQNAILHSDVRANPTAKIRWSKVNSSLPTGRHSQSSNNKLVIRNMRLMDSGAFVCTASNILGSAKVLSKIQVQG